jgi:hypothetical protein
VVTTLNEARPTDPKFTPQILLPMPRSRVQVQSTVRVAEFTVKSDYRSLERIMTLTIDLKPEVEASLATQAKAQGVPLAEYVRSLLEQFACSVRPMTPEQRATALHQWGKGFPEVAPLSDEAVSRESIYTRDH